MNEAQRDRAQDIINVAGRCINVVLAVQDQHRNNPAAQRACTEAVQGIRALMHAELSAPAPAPTNPARDMKHATLWIAGCTMIGALVVVMTWAVQP
jgi:hypothetical protein